MGFNISGMIGGLFGGDDAEEAARLQAQGAQEARDQSEGYYTQGQNYLQPYVQGGQQSGALMDDIIGINGPEKQAAALAMYQSSPSANLLKQAQEEALRQTAGKWASQGGYRSGGMIQDLSRRQSDLALNDYNTNWLGMINNKYGIGASTAGNAANLAQNRGGQVAGLIQDKYGALGEEKIASSRIGNDMLGGLISGVGQGVGYAMSDIRVKRDIERIGALPSGLPVYRFRYVWDDTPTIGVMAHEARDIFPEAVIERPDGYLMVDYAQIS